MNPTPDQVDEMRRAYSAATRALADASASLSWLSSVVGEVLGDPELIDFDPDLDDF